MPKPSTSRIRNRRGNGANCSTAADSRRRACAAPAYFATRRSDAKLRQYFFAGTIRDYQVIIPDFGMIEGPFQIAHLEFSGRHDGELAFEVALQSAGELNFAAV